MCNTYRFGYCKTCWWFPCVLLIFERRRVLFLDYPFSKKNTSKQEMDFCSTFFYCLKARQGLSKWPGPGPSFAEIFLLFQNLNRKAEKFWTNLNMFKVFTQTCYELIIQKCGFLQQILVLQKLQHVRLILFLMFSKSQRFFRPMNGLAKILKVTRKVFFWKRWLFLWNFCSASLLILKECLY